MIHQLRPRVDRDIPFIFRSWLMSAKEQALLARIPEQVFFHHHHAILEDLWQDTSVLWTVAANPADSTFIYGFAAVQMTDTIPIVHYVYVRKNFRRLGIGSALLRAFKIVSGTTVFASHYSGAGKQLCKKLDVLRVYNPYLAWGRTPQTGTRATKKARARVVDLLGSEGEDE